MPNKMKGTPIHNSWTALRQRCVCESNKQFKDYGGRGIKNEWSCFADFYSDMAGSWFDGATIDRIDTDGNYSKNNCKWSTRTEQARNKRETKYSLNDIKFIRNAYEAGTHTQVTLASMFGDSQGNISNIIHRRTWA